MLVRLADTCQRCIFSMARPEKHHSEALRVAGPDMEGLCPGFALICTFRAFQIVDIYIYILYICCMFK